MTGNRIGRCDVIIIVALAIATWTPSLWAQVMRLPAVDVTPAQFVEPIAPGLPPVQYTPGPPMSDWPMPAQPLPGQPAPWPAMPPLVVPPAATGAEPDPDIPRDARPGMFQRLLFHSTWLPRFGEGGFGTTDLDTGVALALPLPTRQWPLSITPGFAVHYLDGPAGVDLPPRVYDAYTQFSWLLRLTPRLRANLAVTAGVFSDFQQQESKAFRLTGHGLAAWNWTPTTRIVLGAAYLNRAQWNILPIAGISWRPDDDTRFDLVFPKPKIARRIYGKFDCPGDVEGWVYLAGALGGGTWAFEHTGGGTDEFNYSDWRVMLGLERKVFGGIAGCIEAGYVFSRRIEFDTGLPDFRPSDTLMLQGSLTY